MWFQRLRGVFRQRDLEREIDAELAFHIAERADELVAEGVGEAEARRRALIQFGSYVGKREEMRDIDLFARAEAILRDLRFGIRKLAGSPLFAAAAILSLALGIGANTAIFSIINALMLRSLPVADPGRLVEVRSKEIGNDFTNPIWEQMKAHPEGFAGMLAVSPDRFDLARGGESQFVNGLWVSGDFFHVLGVPAISGRVFTKSEDRRGTAPLAVISYGFRQRHFAGNESAVGKTVYLNRHPFTVIGVTPPWFRGMDVDKSYDIAIPIACDPILHTDMSLLDNRSAWWLQIFGRLVPGQSLTEAEAQLNANAPALLKATVSTEWPVDSQKDFLKASFRLATAATGFSQIRVQYKTGLLALMSVAGFVLLIACVNIANLLLARASARRREFAVRLALGASRFRLIQQLLLESLLLSIAGAAIGVGLALAGSGVLVRIISTPANPITLDLSPDANLLAFAVGIALLTTLLFGLAPAFRATSGDLNDALKENARGSVAGGSRFQLGKALVAGQIALSLMLIVAAGLFLGTLRNLLRADLGFNPQNVLLIDARFQENTVAKERRTGINDEIVRRLRALPGVVAAASSLRTPITNFGWNEYVQPEGYRPKSRMDGILWLNRVSPGYFSTMHTPVLLGRDFAARDSSKAPKVVIISESTARHFWGAANPLGKTIGFGVPGGGDKKELYQIVGVVHDSKYQRIDEQERHTAFVSSGQDATPAARVTFEVRFSGAKPPVAAVRDAIASVNSGLSLEFQTLETQVNESAGQQRLMALLSTAFGLLALILAVVGLYGVTAYGVSRRRNEIGVRIAMGATRGSVIRLVMEDVARLLVIGIAVGLAASLVLGRFIASLLYGVRPGDPRALAGAALVLAACACIAAYLPAKKAADIDPMTALREE